MRVLRSVSVRWTIVVLIELSLVVSIGLVIVGSAGWAAAESQIVVGVNATHARVLDFVALGVNVLFGPVGAVVVGLLLVVWAGVVGRSWVAGVRTILLLGVPWVLADVVKVIVQRLRPDAGLMQYPVGVDPTTYSYPSGHTAFAAALATTVIVLVARRHRPVAVALGSVTVVVTAWSRVYLGVHYPTDVLASMLLVPVVVVAVYEVTGRMHFFTRRRPGTQGSAELLVAGEKGQPMPSGQRLADEDVTVFVGRHGSLSDGVGDV